MSSMVPSFFFMGMYCHLDCCFSGSVPKKQLEPYWARKKWRSKFKLGKSHEFWTWKMPIFFCRWNQRWKQWTWSTPTTMWHCCDLGETTTGSLWGSLLSLGWSAPWCRRRKSWWQRKRSRRCGDLKKTCDLSLGSTYHYWLRSNASLEISFQSLYLRIRPIPTDGLEILRWPTSWDNMYQNSVHKSYSPQTLPWKDGDSPNVPATFLGFLNHARAQSARRSLKRLLCVWKDDSGEQSWQDSFF